MASVAELRNLPAQLTSFIGRERELAAITALLAEKRLITLTGPGGAGKTRVATEAARRWLGGAACFVELAPLVDQALVPSAIATALGVVEIPDEPLLGTVERFLQSKHALLLMDNCEHLIVGCALAVERLLQACPGLTVLATSREPLNLDGETVQRLLPLALDKAAALFVERASAAEPGFAARSLDYALLERQ